ncbi:MAG TPA: ATP-binding protein [Methanospirillum sp.]|nr:ATP-binding protein [Methanospirillum sp.]
MPAVTGFFDIRTFLFSIVIIELFLTMMMVLYARIRGVYPGFVCWALQLAMLATGQILGALRGVIPDTVSIFGGNFFNTLGLLMIYEAISRFYTGRGIDRRWYLVLPLIMSGIYYWYIVDNSLAYRTVLLSCVFGVISVQTVRILFWKNNVGEKHFTHLLGIIYLILAIIFAERAIDYFFNPIGRTLLEPSVVNTVLYFYILIASIGATFLFLILNVERQARELDSSHSEIRRLATRYDLAISSAGAGVWELDQDSDDIILDSQMIRMFGIEHAEGESPGVRLRERIHPDDWSRLAGLLRGVSQEGVNINEEYRILMDSGETRYHLVHARSFLRENGTGLRIIGLSTEITSLRRYQNALATALHKISILSSITRHDILNCVTVIGMSSQLLLEDRTDLNSPDRKHLLTISDMGDQITRLVRFTHEYDEIGQHEPIWIDPIAILGRKTIQCILGGISLNLPDPGVLVYGDKMIEKVFYNLIDNSIRHGGTIRMISLEYRYDDHDLLIWYTDDGQGVPVDVKEKIFSNGFGKNSGLGLFLCREILSITGISIIENGIEGSGVRFEIRAGPGLYRDHRSKPVHNGSKPES